MQLATAQATSNSRTMRDFRVRSTSVLPENRLTILPLSLMIVCMHLMDVVDLFLLVVYQEQSQLATFFCHCPMAA